MKFMPSQLAYLLSQRQSRQNLRALTKLLVLLVGVVILFAVTFHVLMTTVEDQDHSWITGVYWTLTVMSTLGFGDITFQSDVGRVFSVLVLMSGIVLLLIVLPFAFIRFFYAPWLEAHINIRAPRQVPAETSGHVLLTAWEALATGLVRRLETLEIPYFVLVPDPTRAAELMNDGVRVIAGLADSPATYKAAGIERALAVVASANDPTNTNITLTVREVSPLVPVLAVAEEEDSIDLLELAGATHVLPLKRQLGAQLANRVNTGHAATHVIGRYKSILIAEFPVHGTPLAGRTLRDTKLRQVLGITVVGLWQRGRLVPTRADSVLEDDAVAVVVGTEEQLLELDSLLVIYDTNYNPVLVIGGGKVGIAATKALRAKGMKVHLVEREASLASRLEGIPDRLFIGDAADRTVLMAAGLAEAPSVLLTTNDDAINIYLSVYCRRLNPQLRIVSRITHERNLESIHRAGADFALSYTALGVELVASLLSGRDMVLLGTGIELFSLPLPLSLVGKTLAEAAVGARTGLNVVAVEGSDGHITSAAANVPLPDEATLVALGNFDQHRRFLALFDGG